MASRTSRLASTCEGVQFSRGPLLHLRHVSYHRVAHDLQLLARAELKVFRAWLEARRNMPSLDVEGISGLEYLQIANAGGGSRTHKPRRAEDFKSGRMIGLAGRLGPAEIGRPRSPASLRRLISDVVASRSLLVADALSGRKDPACSGKRKPLSCAIGRNRAVARGRCWCGPGVGSSFVPTFRRRHEAMRARCGRGH